MRINTDFDSLATGLIQGDITDADLAPKGIQYRRNQTWANVERALRETALAATRQQEDHGFLLSERLRKVVFRSTLALTPTVAKQEAILLKETIRFTTKNTNQHRSLARRIQLLAAALPADTDNADYQAALLALDIAATRENIPLQPQKAA